MVFGDDGEKFGTWPETRKHVYDDGWLRRFFDALVQNQHWIQVTTLAEAFDNVPPVGKIYPARLQLPRDDRMGAARPSGWSNTSGSSTRCSDDPRWAALRPFVRGGFWRNFKVKYPEADEMYCRMMMVSRRLQETLEAAAAGEPVNAELVEQARSELYRGQCNCGYWHGAFGGIYLPHLRNAVYQHLIAADNLLDRADRPAGDLDRGRGRRFQFRRPAGSPPGQRQAAWPWWRPAAAGKCSNSTSAASATTCWPRWPAGPKPTTTRCRAGEHQNGDQVASIHDRVVFKQPDLDKRLQYDDHARKSLHRPVLRQRRDAGGGGCRHGAAAGRFPRRHLRSPHPPQSRPHPGANAPRRERLAACRCGSPRA